MSELIDTTEMYLKSIYEMMEDGIAPMRARIVSRLGHSGPTVSQTIARMERDGLVTLDGDRKIVLTPEGMRAAAEVIRKHRLAELLLVDTIGLPWEEVHDEACRWEHVMSERVEQLLLPLLDSPETDPYGNPIPKRMRDYTDFDPAVPGRTLTSYQEEHPEGGTVRIGRIGEPAQAYPGVLEQLGASKMLPGSKVSLRFNPTTEAAELEAIDAGKAGNDGAKTVEIPEELFKHFFIM